MARPTPKQKTELIDYARTHPDESGRSIAKLFGVDPKTVRRWFGEAGLRGLSPTVAKKKAPAKPEKGRGGGEKPSAAAGKRPARVAKPPRSRARSRTLAKDLPTDDRVEAISIVRRARTLATRFLDRKDAEWAAYEARLLINDAIDDDEERAAARRRNAPPGVSRDESQALLNMQKLAAEIIDTHPGLLELSDDSEEKAEDKTARRGRVMAALGIPDGSGS